MHQYVRPIKLPNWVGHVWLVPIPIPVPVNVAELDELCSTLCSNLPLWSLSWIWAIVHIFGIFCFAKLLLTNCWLSDVHICHDTFSVEFFLSAGSDYTQWFAVLYIFSCSTFQIILCCFLPFALFSLCVQTVVYSIKSLLWFPLRSCHLSLPPHISPSSWLGEEHFISPLKCALAHSPFPCCARWIIYVNYSIERYALSTTGNLSVDLFFLLCMYMHVASLGFSS